MVTSVTNFGRNGLADWIIQRFTAVIMTIFTVVIVGFLLSLPEVTHAALTVFFDMLWVRVLSLLVLLSIVAHGWIGLWGVLTDYVTQRMMGAKALSIRFVVLSAYAVVSVAFIVWGAEILWGLN